MILFNFKVNRFCIKTNLNMELTYVLNMAIKFKIKLTKFLKHKLGFLHPIGIYIKTKE